MARIKLVLPKKTLGSFSIPTRITDLNYGQHLGNDQLVSLLHEARVQWLASIDLSELDVGGCGLIMSELLVNYTGECFYPDILHITLYAGDCTRAGFELYYQVETTRKNEPISIAVARTGMVCYQYADKMVVPLPESLKIKLER